MVEVVFAVAFVLLICLFALSVVIVGMYRDRWREKFEKEIRSEDESEKEGEDND